MARRATQRPPPPAQKSTTNHVPRKGFAHGYCGRSLRPRQLTGLAAVRRAVTSIGPMRGAGSPARTTRLPCASMRESCEECHGSSSPQGSQAPRGSCPYSECCRRVWPAKHGFPVESFTSHLWMLGHFACWQPLPSFHGLQNRWPPLIWLTVGHLSDLIWRLAGGAVSTEGAISAALRLAGAASGIEGCKAGAEQTTMAILHRRL